MHELRIYKAHPNDGGKIVRRISPKRLKQMFWDEFNREHKKKSEHSKRVSKMTKRAKGMGPGRVPKVHYAIKEPKRYRQCCKIKGVQYFSRALNEKLTDDLNKVTCSHCLRKLKGRREYR